MTVWSIWQWLNKMLVIIIHRKRYVKLIHRLRDNQDGKNLNKVM